MPKSFASYIIYHVMHLDHGPRLADAIDFFIYDTLKIFLLLPLIIFTVSIVRSYFTLERTGKILSHKNEFIGNVLAAPLGMVTPFCQDEE